MYHETPIAGKPMRASLLKKDVAGNDILAARLLRAQSLSGTIFRSVGSSLGLMRGVSSPRHS